MTRTDVSEQGAGQGGDPGTGVRTGGPASRPLVVDLDGTLTPVSLDREARWHRIGAGQGPWAAITGRLEPVSGDPAVPNGANLPYRPDVLRLVEEARANGRSVYLVTSGPRARAEAIASRLGTVADILVSAPGAARSRAADLVTAFGERGFDYVGRDDADMPVWTVAAGVYAVEATPAVRRALAAARPDAVHLGTAPPTWRDPAAWRLWARAIRVHQYVKNTLVFVPVLTAHLFTPTAFASALLAFVAFSACASAVYLLNDSLDLQADRAHPSKRNRPLASGQIGIGAALRAIPVLLAVAAAAALAVSPAFAGVLLGYLALTTAYSVWLKRKTLIDIVVLALLYTVRVIGGAVAIAAPVSEWLLIFSLMMFTALALIKRYTELTMRFDADLGDPPGRDYRLDDLTVIAALAAAAGMNVVTIFALYVSSAATQALYSRPALLWLICPILLYWIGRALLMAHRRLMHDDPIVFALRDRVSRIAVACMIVVVGAAI